MNQINELPHIDSNLTHWTKFDSWKAILLSRQLIPGTHKTNANEQRWMHRKGMICFTDIPYSISKSQRIQYGSWGIGFDKQWLESMGANPVFYYGEKLNSAHDSMHDLRQRLFKIEDEKIIDKRKLNEFLDALGIINQYWQSMHSGRKEYSEYFEREWRLHASDIELHENGGHLSKHLKLDFKALRKIL